MVIARAPVRISFGGGGTDLAAYYEQFGGFVVSAAITRYCYVIARPTTDGSVRINSSDYRIWEQFAPGTIPTVDEPLSLAKAAIEWAMQRNLLPQGADVFLSAEVPPGTGLGSSSAMSVALLHGLTAMGGQSLRPVEAAEAACALEIERLNRPIGKQDQYASALGGVNTIEFNAEGVTATSLGVSAKALVALSERLMLFATGQSRDSAVILGEQRDHTTTKPEVIEALHRIKALAYDMSEALVAEELDLFGRLLDRAWQEKRSLSGKVSSEAIDSWYDTARLAGALGGKIAGAGGGGFLLLYCPPERQAAVRAALAATQLRELAFDLDPYGAQVFQGLTAGTTNLPKTDT
jgi:D-glycero-alpha-D-manno-heptose-7-phosphate kinase